MTTERGAGHTKGPWVADDWRMGRIDIRAEGFGCICQVNAHMEPNPDFGNAGKANARLIAAAPDLLAALEMVKATCGDASHWNGETRAFLEAADAAIARAKGEA